MNQIFVSDLHLEANTQHYLHDLDRLLGNLQSAEDQVYILGDLVDLWIGDDDDSEFAESLRSTLRKHGERTQLFLMHGNRDFLLGARFSEEVGATLLPDPYVISINGQSVLLSHGDRYCTSDREYQEMRTHFRSQEWQNEFLDKTLTERLAYAKHVRTESTRANQVKSDTITDVVEAAIIQDLERYDCSTMIHGHTHRPGQHRMKNGLHRYVLGAWERCGWIIQSQPRLTLSCFPLIGTPL